MQSCALLFYVFNKVNNNLCLIIVSFVASVGNDFKSRQCFRWGQESPDSAGQCTGEEPGSMKMETDSATENNLTQPLSIYGQGR
jgi:hypothetical protein